MFMIHTMTGSKIQNMHGHRNEKKNINIQVVDFMNCQHYIVDNDDTVVALNHYLKGLIVHRNFFVHYYC